MMLKEIITDIMSSEKLLIIQCSAFLLLNILDGYTTWLVMRPDHYERERNPIARWVFRKLKLPGSIIFFKTFLMSFLGVFIASMWTEALTFNTGLLIGNLLYIPVVIHNYNVHKKYVYAEQQLQKLLYYRVIPE